MADGVNEKANEKETKQNVTDNMPEKRKTEERGDGEPAEKKFSMNIISKKPLTALDSSKKISISLNSAKTGVTPIKMSLSSQKPKETSVSVKPKTAAVAKAFNEEDDSDEEEMPPEAKMRMRNIGRDTPTAAGPNSFGKGRLGFCDRQKIYERDLKKHMDAADHD